MRRFFLLSLFLFTTFSCYAQAAKQLAFAGSSWEGVMQRAEKENKAVFLYAYTPFCGFCAKMEKEVFIDEAVAEFYNSTFISYKINIDDEGEGEALAEQYGIVSFPTYLYFSSKGELLHQSAGAKRADAFILDGQNALNPQKALFSLKGRYDAGERSASLLYDYSTALSYYHHQDSPEEQVVAEYLQTQSVEQLDAEQNLRYIFEKGLSFNSPATQYFLKHQHTFTPLYTPEEVARKAQNIIINAARTAGEEGNMGLLEAVELAIKANFRDTSKLSALASIYFYQGQSAWLKYAEASMAYANQLASNDWQTLQETATYLKHFAEEKQALEIGAQLMEKVIGMHKNYKHLYLYAQLQQKAGREDLALEAAKEAIKVALEAGADSSQAARLIADLQGE
jgi:thioredoxin-related protein